MRKGVSLSEWERERGRASEKASVLLLIRSASRGWWWWIDRRKSCCFLSPVRPRALGFVSLAANKAKRSVRSFTSMRLFVNYWSTPASPQQHRRVTLLPSRHVSLWEMGKFDERERLILNVGGTRHENLPDHVEDPAGHASGPARLRVGSRVGSRTAATSPGLHRVQRAQQRVFFDRQPRRLRLRAQLLPDR